MAYADELHARDGAARALELENAPARLQAPGGDWKGGSNGSRCGSSGPGGGRGRVLRVIVQRTVGGRRWRGRPCGQCTCGRCRDARDGRGGLHAGPIRGLRGSGGSAGGRARNVDGTAYAACDCGGSTDAGSDDSDATGAAPDADVTQACSDNAAEYCAQLSTCSPFLLSTQYGDTVTCETRLAGAYCNNMVTAEGSGWTADGLEGCIAAREALSCTDFLYLKPAPSACRPTGTIASGGCLWDSQCSTGYCRIASGMQCGTCVERGNAGAPCTTSNDCDGNLVCTAVCARCPCLWDSRAAPLCRAKAEWCVCRASASSPGALARAATPTLAASTATTTSARTATGTMCAAITVAMSASVRGLVPAGCLLCRRRLPGRLLRPPARRRLSVRRRRGCELHDPVHMQLRHVQHPERQSVSLTQTISSKATSAGFRPWRADRRKGGRTAVRRRVTWAPT